MQSIRSLLKVRSADPGDARQRRRLTVLLAGMAALSAVTLLLTLIVSSATTESAGIVLSLGLVGGVLLLCSIALFAWLSARNLEDALAARANSTARFVRPDQVSRVGAAGVVHAEADDVGRC